RPMSRVASRPRLSVTVQRAVRCAWLPDRAAIRRWAAGAAGPERGGELAVRIVGEAEAGALNATYRREEGAIHIESFPTDAPELPDEEEPLPLGDLVICAPVVEREAEEQGKSVTAHFAHLVVHGTLHLIGHDHEEEAEARVMEDRERDVLAGFGFEDP